MTDRKHVKSVGAPDPELKNSAIADEGDDEFEVIKLEAPGKYVYSGGTCDPDNP